MSQGLQNIKPIIDPEEDVIELIHNLEDATKLKKNGRCIKFTQNLDISENPVQSWKFNEWDYGKEHKIRLPCNARGLFTIGNRIAVRGYDKFFNVDEVASTKKSHLQQSMTSTYDLTLKENGCIIFISGLSNGELIVCSKHSVGVRDDLTRNHAIQGEIQIKHQLAQIGKQSQDLAKILYDLNLTAVAELCDDEFEEHVLEYSKNDSGLYLHGLNYNTINFKTCPVNLVTQFAKDWGFKSVGSFQIKGFDQLWDFLKECRKTGTYNLREVEGFVVRTKIEKTGEDFFFKYKFEEPYLLYRQFREVTKKFIKDQDIAKIIKSLKKHKFITLKYLEFIKELFEEQPNLKDDYIQGFGIIKVRKLFLQKNNLSETSGMDLISIDEKQSQNLDEFKKLEEKLASLSINQITKYKYILIPIATIGCGKTTTFQTLIHLFPNWAHVQNDNIGSGKIAKQQLISQSLTHLKDSKCDLVFCDRNNHQFREREQLFKDFEDQKVNYLSSDTGIKFVAVNFVKDSLTEKQLWDITYDRIVKRGDNHQSIKSTTDAKLAHLIMKGFIQRFQPINIERNPDCQFDLVIDMEIDSNSSKSNALSILKVLLKNFPDLVPQLPSSENLETAFQKSLTYTPTYHKTFGRSSSKASTSQPAKQKKKTIAYYGVAIDDGTQLIKSVADAVGELKVDIWNQILANERLQPSFHVTLSHIISVKNDLSLQEKWNTLTKQFEIDEQNLSIGTEKMFIDFYADVQLKRLVFVLEKLATVEALVVGSYNSQFEKLTPFPYTNKYLHITLGTASPEVKPFLSNEYIHELHNFFGDKEIVDGIHVVKEDLKFEIFNFKDDIVLEKQRCFYHF